MTFQSNNNNNNGGPFSSIVGILIMVGVILGLYYISKAIFNLLYFLSPILFIATLVIDYKVVLNFGKWLVNLTKRNTVLGVGAILIALLAYPLTAMFLFSKALFKRKVEQVQKNYETQTQGELVDYEEIESTPTKLELPELEKRTQQKSAQPKSTDNDYEQLFE